MPTISVFFGITIHMYWRDHAPPHFHAVYAEYDAVIEIHTLRVTSGYLPNRALSLALEWARAHRDALMEDWELCQQQKTPKRIPPLE